VSHILRNRTTSPSTGVATDRWFHYDQVGSVLSESNAAGALTQTHHQDAFGNTQAAWQTGLWGGDRAGWHHNTKELDGDTGLVYMYQRWYSPETGTFMSSAPYPVTMEHRYGFADNGPTIAHDAGGRLSIRLPTRLPKWLTLPWWLDPHAIAVGLLCADLAADAAAGWAPYVTGPTQDSENALRHCIWMCCMIKNGNLTHAEAKGIGDWKEKDQGGSEDSEVDQHNNAKGRGYGACKDASCLSSCMEGVRNGDLR
jgi:RHS repeat-associated protein